MATETKDETTGPAQVNVHPSTLGIRDLMMGPITAAGVYGGANGQVWVATFADPGEAQAFILASNHFKRPVNGYMSDYTIDDRKEPEPDGAGKPN